MAPVGHTAPQCPQPMHPSPLTTADLASTISRTKLGQIATHRPQAIQSSVTTTGGFIFCFITQVSSFFPIGYVSRMTNALSYCLNHATADPLRLTIERDRKSTRLNSS